MLSMPLSLAQSRFGSARFAGRPVSPPSSLHFGEHRAVRTEEHHSSPGKVAPKAKRDWKRRLFEWSLDIAPLTSLGGGLALLTSFVMPNQVKLPSFNPASLSGPDIQHAQAAPKGEAEEQALFLADAKKFFHDAGWMLFSVSNLAGAVNQTTMGYKRKQPCSVLSGVLNAAVVTPAMFVFQGAVPVQAALMYTIAMNYAGLAQPHLNRANGGQGEQRTFDMAPLVQAEKLKTLLPEGQAPTAPAIARAWTHYALKMLDEVNAQQMAAVKDSVRAAKNLAKQSPGKTLTDVRQELVNLKAYLDGKTQTPPPSIQPESAAIQQQLALTFINLGNVVALVATGPMASLQPLALGLYAAGQISGNSGMVVEAAQQGDKPLGFGAVLIMMGNTSNDFFAGVRALGLAPLNTYFKAETLRPKSELLSEAEATQRLPDSSV